MVSDQAGTAPPSVEPWPAVLIDIDDEGLFDRVVLVTGSAHYFTTDKLELPPRAHLELVVSTRSGALARLGLSTGAARDVGLIVIGCEDPEADALLPADFSDRELTQACRLVAQITQWRRKAMLTAETGRHLERLAHTDPLTQVANRRGWELELPRRLAAAAAAGHDVALAVFDVDHFKPVNDERGHAAGDAVLAAIGRGLADSLRAADFVARLGGDEFGLLLIGSFDAAAVLRIVDRVRVHAMQGLAAGGESAVTLSAGCTAPQRGSACDVVQPDAAAQAYDAAQLFAAADAALRAAKKAGRNRTFIDQA